MPRPPKIRVSYHSDALFLLRLAEAISMDGKLDPTYRAELCKLVNQCARRLLDAHAHFVSGLPDSEINDETEGK